VSRWGEHKYSGFVEVSLNIKRSTECLEKTLTERIRGSDQVQHSNHAAAAKLNVFKHMMVLTEGMALKAVILGSLALAFLA
jgi:hypothetical protein